MTPEQALDTPCDLRGGHCKVGLCQYWIWDKDEDGCYTAEGHCGRCGD